MDWNKQVILITGGTGSFGKKAVEILLREYHPQKIIILSRDELKQHEMRMSGFNHPSLRYFIGDVRNEQRLRRAFRDVDLVIHAAALKQVPACEYNPMEAVMTNIMGARNIIEAALDNGVQKVIALSTDKAAGPINLYGATKLVSEKLFVQGNAYRGKKGARFSAVRYGNVVGSRGSVIPLFKKQRERGKITITDKRMTRFWITLDQGVRFVLSSLEMMHGGELFIPKIPSMRLIDLAQTIAPDSEIEVIGIRPGEKLHESMITPDEARQVVELTDRYLLLPSHPWWPQKEYLEGKPVADGFSYRSDNNRQWLTPEDLQRMVDESNVGY